MAELTFNKIIIWLILLFFLAIFLYSLLSPNGSLSKVVKNALDLGHKVPPAPNSQYSNDGIYSHTSIGEKLFLSFGDQKCVSNSMITCTNHENIEEIVRHSYVSLGGN